MEFDRFNPLSMKGYCRYRCAINEGARMTILLWIVGGLTAWCLLGFCWLRLFASDETENDYEECPYD
ncbi:hypothetical protein [Enterobacter hormaechei]|uniref:hypothetical protein n=1 Tax=Enterobacter hormaechei TaxID=158836 RepID=UPI000FCBC901|nr:hypothetical protein [Enterobacter hormaechei]MBT1722945.1 hypothetical protein [Enterobacter hormaechei subsp. hoffmannii]MCL8112695.1 hypothetical protein [Enterobacter hormaechei]MCM8209998.1 hypothetical protein [Enterobacter hormaechei]MDS0248041.1 hypothetical protein [Enterobacter hormaechei]QMV98163.1 hypothetical protein H2678_05325 [Enterobacter hormaechei]